MTDYLIGRFGLLAIYEAVLGLEGDILKGSFGLGGRAILGTIFFTWKRGCFVKLLWEGGFFRGWVCMRECYGWGFLGVGDC